MSKDLMFIASNAHSKYAFCVARANLDQTDREIIGLLLEDGRRSATDVGRKIGLSPAAAKRRIDRLEALDIILG
jgi:DNA-binding Lrp family transcriptional regulator